MFWFKPSHYKVQIDNHTFGPFTKKKAKQFLGKRTGSITKLKEPCTCQIPWEDRNCICVWRDHNPTAK